MRAVVIYESMFGSTRRTAEAVAEGLGAIGEVRVASVAEADAALHEGADLLVVGAPTHVHGMSRPRTRTAAREMTEKEGAALRLEPGAEGPGVREWLATLPRDGAPAAAFDTRVPFPLAGHASKAIARALRHHGHPILVPGESFLVDETNVLGPGEEVRARSWGEELASRLLERAATGTAARS